MMHLPLKTETSDFPDLAGANILLVDDEQAMYDIVSAIVLSSGAHLDYVLSIKEAISLSCDKRFDVALIDMRLPDGSGVELVGHLREKYPDMAIIVITGYADSGMAYSLENAGIQSVLTKPFSVKQLRFTLCKELARRKLLLAEGAVCDNQPDNFTDEDSGAGLSGNSAYINDLRKKISVFCQGNMPILIQGPTGTGKEIIARAIHRLGNCGTKTMITVNSSAIPEHLEESEFFGHAKGAFTGAHEEKEGIIQCANGSSLFLDEVGELSLRMQAKLLRVLDGHEYTRIGESKPRKTDFRLISATNRPLLDMIADGTFRQDLYFRLKAGTIETKPLASYAEDIPLLVNHFLAEFGKRGRCRFTITGEAMETLVKYDWPGNVRELRNVVDSLCTINVKSRTITAESIEWVITDISKQPNAEPSPFAEAKLGFEKKFYIRLLAKHAGNITMSAKEAGIDRPNFSKKLKAMGICAAEYKVKASSKN